VILRYVLRGLARRKTRAAMGVLGVFCTLALLTAVHAGFASVSTSYVDLASLQAGKADVLVRRAGSEWHRPEAFEPTSIPARPEIAGFAPRLLGVQPVTAGGAVRFALVVGIDPAREAALGIDGFRPAPALGPHRAALSESLAKAFAGAAPRIGDVELQPAGVVEHQTVFPQHLKDFVVLDLATARAALGEPTGVHILAGALRDPRAHYDARDLHRSVRGLKDVGEAVAEALGPDWEVKLPRAEAITAFEQASGPARALFGVFALVALAITALLIHSLVSVSVEERVRELGILRTLGARRRHVVALVLAEAAVVCLSGVLPGAFAGLLVAKGVLALVGGMGIPLAGASDTLRLSLAAGAAVALASALAPALRASRGRIVEALDPLRRGETAGRTSKGAALWTGLALSALSGTVFFLLPGAVLSGDPSLIGGVALGLLVVLIVGLTLTALAAAPWAERVVMACAAPFFGPAAELAARNLGRHRRRNASTSLLFALSVAFVLFLAALAAFVSRTSSALIERRVGAALRVSLDDPAADGLAEELTAIPGVAGTARALTLRARTPEGIAYDVVASDLVGMKHLWVVPVGVEASLKDVAFPAQYEEGGPEALEALGRDDGASEVGPAVVAQSLARVLDVGKGDLLALTFRLGAEKREARVRIAAVCSAVPGVPAIRARAANAQGSGLLLAWPRFLKLTSGVPAEARDGFALMATSGDPLAAAAKVREALALRHRAGVECAAEERREAEALYWATQVLFAMLLWVATAIALFGLVASTATAVLERRREIGVLKAVGLRRGDLYRMFAAEAVAVTLASGLLGGGMGWLLAWLFALQAGAFLEARIPLTLPWLAFGAAFAVCAAAGLVAAWLPTRRLLRRPVAEILRG
jgi:putative ABC transport system permease protein